MCFRDNLYNDKTVVRTGLPNEKINEMSFTPVRNKVVKELM
jgi:hypothetical protein